MNIYLPEDAGGEDDLEGVISHHHLPEIGERVPGGHVPRAPPGDGGHVEETSGDGGQGRGHQEPRVLPGVRGQLPAHRQVTIHVAQDHHHSHKLTCGL